MEQRRIIDRIRKLLRLSESPNPNEAQLALERAFEIAARYDIDVHNVDVDEDLRRIINHACDIGFRLSLSKRLTLGLVSTYWNVSVVLSYPAVHFLGTEADVKIALFVWEFLHATVDRQVKELRYFWGHRFTENRRRLFLHGWCYGVSEGLHKRRSLLELEEKSYALVLASSRARLDQAKAEFFPRTVCMRVAKPKRQEPAWINLGFLKGKEVQIRKPLESPTQLILARKKGEIGY
jgi:hypothetical protein